VRGQANPASYHGVTPCILDAVVTRRINVGFSNDERGNCHTKLNVPGIMKDSHLRLISIFLLRDKLTKFQTKIT
jgi:hypothetical protein